MLAPFNPLRDFPTMKTTLRIAATAAVLALAGLQAQAQGTGSQGYFTIHNDTADNTLIGFYTNDGSGWSDNWLVEDIAAGHQSVAEFTADTGSCAQELMAGWLGTDGGEVLDEPFSIDICDASHVYLGDNDISYE
jgi:hypothetical protein